VLTAMRQFVNANSPKFPNLDFVCSKERKSHIDCMERISGG
jgi:hypothetical protein